VGVRVNPRRSVDMTGTEVDPVSSKAVIVFFFIAERWK